MIMAEQETIPIDERCLKNLYHIWTHTESPTIIFLDGAAGSGSRQIIRQLQHRISDDCLTWHMRCIADEFGEVLMPKILGGLWKGIWRSDNVSSRMASIMHSTLPMLEDADDQKRMQVLIDSLKTYRDFKGEKIILPDNRPLLSLVQLGSILGQIDPLLIIFEDAHLCYSPLITTFLECLYTALPKDCKVVTIITTDRKIDDPSLPLGLQQLSQNMPLVKDVSIQPWNYSTIQRFFQMQDMQVDGMAEEWWSGGWVGRVLEIQELYQRGIELPSLTMPFEDSQTEHVLRTASLLDSTIRIDVLARLSGCSEDVCMEVVNKNPLYVKTTFTDPLERKLYIEFHASSVQIRLQEDTIKKRPNLVKDVVKRIRNHIGSLSPHYQVQSLYLISQTNASDELYQQHRDLLAQERDDVWLQVLDLRMRFDLQWSKSLEGYMYVGAVRYLSKLDLPNLQIAFEEALNWSQTQGAPLTEMELFTIMIDYHLQRGNLDTTKEYWNSFTKLADNQRDGQFLFRKEILSLRLQSIGLIEQKDIHDMLQSVENPIQKITIIRMYANQPNSQNRCEILHLGYELSKSALFEKTTIDLGLQYLEISLLEKGQVTDNDLFDDKNLQNLQEIQSELQSRISDTTSDWERFANLCTELGLQPVN
jgi:hypothetical protein